MRSVPAKDAHKRFNRPRAWNPLSPSKHANWKRRWDMYIGGGVLALILIILLLIWLF
jgi:hypothetical protein